MTRYHPLLVTIHWLMGLLIIMMLIFGNLVTGPLDNADPEKIEALTGHMAIGVTIGMLLIFRIIVRVRSQTPAHATTGNPMLDKIGVATHHLMYVVVAGMVLSGLGMGLGLGLFGVVYGGEGALPVDLSERLPARAHDMISNILLLLVVLHVAAAFYHQLILRDGLFRRMWFGKRQ
ncbi:cytochrome B561 [Actibacterium mucosum KCTC 23349]|uniref:Cytochrome B561 n=1 Tax=Actibacterium mucosum KCTC 23349 TaxID=1454373 RepID=A0A037ZH74_9RHOB|nr:cytochrome b/b6 domain-containing protein [Actibacterium mucosum]KAJ54949.1 cytochrome B561 [Actibacterium mucosum KCTC 23349]